MDGWMDGSNVIVYFIVCTFLSSSAFNLRFLLVFYVKVLFPTVHIFCIGKCVFCSKLACTCPLNLKDQLRYIIWPIPNCYVIARLCLFCQLTIPNCGVSHTVAAGKTLASLHKCQQRDNIDSIWDSVAFLVSANDCKTKILKQPRQNLFFSPLSDTNCLLRI